ncbi:hypothetical protein F4782DRAFT_165933 [Xylaria castorea]|nr:hypothetical protein F4782DRAFT_165933 [Xylaria castorea]
MIADGMKAEWIGEEEAFRSWTASPVPAVLNVIGAEGTHISSYALSANINTQVLVLSFEFDRWDSRRNSEQALLSSFIRQLLTLHPGLYRTIERIANHLVAQSNVARGRLLTLFCALLSNTEPSNEVLLIVNQADQCLQPLRSTLESLIAVPTMPKAMKVLVTTSIPLKLSGRYYELFLSGLNLFELTAYMVRQGLSQIICHNPGWQDHQNAIHRKLCAEDCTHLQVLLNLGFLEHGYVPSTKNGITQYLSKKTPQPEEILEIVVSGLSEGEPAILLLNWVFHALRPLTISELAVALTLTPDKLVEDNWDSEMICGELSSTTVRNLITSMSAILKIVAGEVMLVHYSIRECLKAHTSVIVPNFNAFATTCCLKYMSTCSAYIGTTSSIEESTIATAFLEYAESFWPEHYKLESWSIHALDNEVHEFLTSKSIHFKRWMSNYRDTFQWCTDIDSRDTLLLAIRLGFREIVRAIDDHGGIADPDRRIVALATAAGIGNTEIFRDLYRTVPRNLSLGRVLCAAAEHGHTDIVRLLMRQENDASFLSDGSSQETSGPLLLAVFNGHAETVEALLSCGRPIAILDELARDGRREPRSRIDVVFLAARTGDFETLSVLKRLRPDEFKALVGTLDFDGRSPLELCCLSGSPPAFDFLFSVSEPTDEELYRLVYSAAERGSLVILDRLLDTVVSPLYGSIGTPKCPIQAAVENGHYAVVSKLVSEGEKLFKLIGTALWKTALSSAFKVCFRNYHDAGCPEPRQNDDNPNYDGRIVALLAPHREVSPEADAIAMESAAFYGEQETIAAILDSGGSL